MTEPNDSEMGTPHTESSGNAGPDDPNIDDLIAKLERLETTVDDDHERRKVRQTIALVERMPGSRAFTRRVSKYTTRDMAEAFVGAVLFSLPLLVEDGVFEIADYLTSVTIASVPPFFIANVVFVVVLTAGMLYYTDFRDVQIHRPVFGIIPRRLIGVLAISLLTATLMMYMWGRLAAEDPTSFETVGRVTVIWAAAAFGAALGDILPGESTGTDVSELLDRPDSET
ncbi:hypothetical protein AArcSl_1143 [Halalkaliarchaeum desulfuricum]|uniref:DUF2391 domain-containing protein n=1 Tax=Halalkaliarchaeum desulfuricum TaxID=2055893 RepID=A0A343TI56_9EURY|nr:DUF2391 family protein [Halalkaliarchaeum desulfuricum]AUX08778.1 hypothetical protein AArcSl_1143 [Halalkaliarchaeum desulfuricum]